MKNIIIQGITVEDFFEEMASRIEGQRATTAPALEILKEAVPKLTKAQAAKLLGCSKAYIDELVRSGYLQESGRTVEKYDMRQVLQCLADGRTGRNQPLSLKNLIK